VYDELIISRRISSFQDMLKNSEKIEFFDYDGMNYDPNSRLIIDGMKWG